MYTLSETFADRVEFSEAAHWSSLVSGLAALPGNPYGAAVQRFGRIVALACPGMRERSFVNRILCAGSDDHPLDDAIAWLRSKGVPVRIDVTPAHFHELELRRLARLGFRHLGFQTALYGETGQLEYLSIAAPVAVAPAETEAEFAFAAQALPTAFGASEPQWVAWLTDSMWVSFRQPNWRTYVAVVDGQLAGFGQMYMDGSVACLALAGTLPEFRGRGVQTALIRRRIQDAIEAGCDLVTAQTGFGTVSQQNMERAGLHVAYTKAEYYDKLPG